MGMNLLTWTIVGMVAVVAALVVVLLLMDRGRSQSPAAYRRAREVEVAHERQVRAQNPGAGGIGQAGDEMPRLSDL
jgi:hypothetical protein